jgi:hypothetical protein
MLAPSQLDLLPGSLQFVLRLGVIMSCAAWLLIKLLQVALDGVSVDYLNPDVKLPKAAEQELKW